MSTDGSIERPIYYRVLESIVNDERLFQVVCDEGIEQTVVCRGMQLWAANWLIAMLGRRPYGDHTRPRAGAFVPRVRHTIETVNVAQPVL